MVIFVSNAISFFCDWSRLHNLVSGYLLSRGVCLRSSVWGYLPILSSLIYPEFNNHRNTGYLVGIMYILVLCTTYRVSDKSTYSRNTNCVWQYCLCPDIIASVPSCILAVVNDVYSQMVKYWKRLCFGLHDGRTIGYQLNTTYIIDRCHHNIKVGRSGKYKSDRLDLIDLFPKSATNESKKGELVTTTSIA